LNILLDGKTHQVSEGATGFDLYEDRSIVAITVFGEPKDLSYSISEGDEIAGVSVSSDLGLSILRHSAAHVMAQAVQEIFDKSKLGIGPPITDGFYFDFDVDTPFTPDDLRKIEKRMKELVGKSQRFMRRDVSDDEARKLMRNEPYKLELIGLKSGDVGEAAAEVGQGRTLGVRKHQP
jgi:Threonyl-tRNA synthetase